MTDIQDEAYSEAMDEIQRLRNIIESQVERLDYLEERHANDFNLEEDIKTLKAKLSQEQCTTQRLKIELMKLAEERDNSTEAFEKHLAGKDAEIERLKAEVNNQIKIGAKTSPGFLSDPS